jgi:hypothetical protein
MGDSFEEIGRRIGALVDVKNKAYGSSFDACGEFLKLLYPNGIKPEQYIHALCLVRIFDKMMRIATDKDALGESPYQDIAGYAILGLRRIEREHAAALMDDLEVEEEELEEETPKRTTMGEAMATQGENPMFPPMLECNDPQKTKGALNPDEHIRIPRAFPRE